MKNLPQFLLFCFFFAYCTEPPTFERNNTSDPLSSSFVPDTIYEASATISEQLELPYYINDVVTLEWPQKSYANTYEVKRTDFFGNSTFIGSFDSNQTSLKDTLTEGGVYVYEIKAISDNFFTLSFAEAQVSHFTLGSDMLSDKQYYGQGTISISENRALVYQSETGRNYFSEIYSFETNSWEIIQNPNCCDLPQATNLSSVRTRVIGRSSTIIFNEDSNTWTDLTNYDSKLPAFRIHKFSETNIIILGLSVNGKNAVYRMGSLGVPYKISTHIYEVEYFNSIKIEDKIYTFGGYDLNTGEETNKIFTFNPNTLEWNETGTLFNMRTPEYLFNLNNGKILAIPINVFVSQNYSYELFDLNTLETDPRTKLESVVFAFQMGNDDVVILTIDSQNNLGYQIFYSSNNTLSPRIDISDITSFLRGSLIGIALNEDNTIGLIPTTDKKSLIFRSSH
ncbi:MAG: kelch repeat-containing protein [Balneola sp.]